jgi:hypothetical protein
MKASTAAWACLLAAASPALAQDRELSTDRPDRTESAYTVPAGRWQVEMDVLGWTRDRAGGTTFDGLGVATSNIKRGLHPRADLQVVIEPWNASRLSAPDLPDVEHSGFGDVTVRLKLNLWGNDGGPTALAVMPYATFPAGVEGIGAEGGQGGLIVPLALELPGGWGAGLMAEIDRFRDDAGGLATGWVFSATASHAIAGELSGYLELFSLLVEGEPWAGTGDAGLTYGVTPDVQLDGGVNLGLTDEVEDFTLFLGLSVRR